MRKIQKYQAEASGWIIYLVKEQNINTSKYKPLSSSSYIKLSKELNHSRKRLINIENTGNSKCLKSCLARYLHHVDKDLSRIRKIDRFC